MERRDASACYVCLQRRPIVNKHTFILYSEDKREIASTQGLNKGGLCGFKEAITGDETM